MKFMKMFLCLILIALLLSCSSNYLKQDIQNNISNESLPETIVSQENEPLQNKEDNISNENIQQTYKKTIIAHTNFELKNGGFEPQFKVILDEDIILEGEGDNLTAIFPNGNILSLGWCFIYEIRKYDKYDNPLYYYENPQESLGYISHERVACGPYECLRVVCQAYNGKENTDPIYRFDYFIIVNEFEVLNLSFFASDRIESTIKTQEKFISTIER